MEIISIYIFNIDKKSTLSEKVDMAIFFQCQYRQYRQIEAYRKKTIYRNTNGAYLLWFWTRSFRLNTNCYQDGEAYDFHLAYPIGQMQGKIADNIKSFWPGKMI